MLRVKARTWKLKNADHIRVVPLYRLYSGGTKRFHSTTGGKLNQDFVRNVKIRLITARKCVTGFVCVFLGLKLKLDTDK